MRFFQLLLVFCIHLMASPSFAQPTTDALLHDVLTNTSDLLLKQVLQHPASYRVQVIYTQINRNRNNTPAFKHYYFHYDPDAYFNPASMVKMPLAFLALEKLNDLKLPQVNKHTTIFFDSSQVWHRPLYKDTTAASGLPSIAHFIKRAFLISENDPYNRFYQFVGQGAINRNLHRKGYKDIRITRQFMGQTFSQNGHTPPVRFVDGDSKTLYSQPPAINTDSFDFSHTIRLGKAHYDLRDSIVHEPFDFTRHNNLSLGSMQQILQSVMFPGSVPAQQRFRLNADDLSFVYRYLSQYPSETGDPKYDTAKFYDSYVKFFFRDSTRRMPAHVRVFNKVGWSYGFLTDVSYVVDFKNRVEFMLAATVYVNSDGILNDSKYEYDSVGYPFLHALGQTVYQYELKRKRAFPPDLSAFVIKYERRNPDDKRASLSEVDN